MTYQSKFKSNKYRIYIHPAYAIWYKYFIPKAITRDTTPVIYRWLFWCFHKIKLDTTPPMTAYEYRRGGRVPEPYRKKEP